MQDLCAGPPHVAGHFDEFLLQRVCVLGQLVQAEGPGGPPRVQLGLHRLRGGTRGQRGQGSSQVSSKKKKKRKQGFGHLRELSHQTDTILPGELEIQDEEKNKPKKTSDERLAPARPRSANDF